MAEAGDQIEAIRRELRRIGADADAVGPIDAIGVKDYGEGYAAVRGSPRAPDFNWYGPAAVILERLDGLPDGSGPEAVRSEFHDGI